MNSERDNDGVEHSQHGAHDQHHAHSDQEGGAGRAADRGRAGHRSRLTVGLVAAAVLLAGGGGAYWVAAAHDGGDGAASSRPAPLRLDDGRGRPAVDSAPGATTAGGAGYQLTGALPKGPRSAAVYRATGQVDQARVQRLAELLGMSGRPAVSGPGAWTVTTAGGGPVLMVSRAAPGDWTYSRYGAAAVPGPVPGTGPAGSSSSRSSGNAASGATTPANTAPGATTPGNAAPGDTASSSPVSAGRAEAVTAPLFAGLGLSGARVDAAQTVGDRRMVSADPVVGGLPTHGWATTAQVGPDGTLTMGQGRLAPLVKGASYPVVAAETAFRQLNASAGEQPDHGVSSCVAPRPAPPISPIGPGTDKTLPTSLPCVPGGGHPVEVRGATFGLSTQFVSSAQTLVPSWLFATAPAGVDLTTVVAAVAVDPAYIQVGAGGPGAGGPGADAPGGPSPVRPGVPVDPGGPMRPVDPTPPSGPGKPAVPAQPPNPLPGGQPGRPGQKVPISGYQADGATLSVTFEGGLCSTYTTTAAETGAQVRVTVTAVPKGKHQMCPMIARSFTQKVVLALPLGNRTVVDASDGQPVMGQ